MIVVLLCLVGMATKAFGLLEVAITGYLGVVSCVTGYLDVGSCVTGYLGVISCVMPAAMALILLHRRWVSQDKVRPAKLVAAHIGEAYSWYSQPFTLTYNVLILLCTSVPTASGVVFVWGESDLSTSMQFMFMYAYSLLLYCQENLAAPPFSTYTCVGRVLTVLSCLRACCSAQWHLKCKVC